MVPAKPMDPVRLGAAAPSSEVTFEKLSTRHPGLSRNAGSAHRFIVVHGHVLRSTAVWLSEGRRPTSLRMCSHCRICARTVRCRCLRWRASPSVSLPSRPRRCRRVPGSARTPAGRRRGPWPVPSGLATSPLASGRCWPSVTAHRCEDGSRHPRSLMRGTWPRPSPAGGPALGSVVSWSSLLRPAVPWRAAASPAG
jgi:hypothetical protein